MSVRIDDPRTAVSALRSELAQTVRSLGRAAPGTSLLHIETPLERLDILDWLRAQTTHTKVYWADRERAFEVAGIGAVIEIRGTPDDDPGRVFADLRTVLSRKSPYLRAYGGFRFDPARDTATHWEQFGAFHFVVPEFEVTRRGNRFYLACNLAPHEHGNGSGRLGDVFDRLEALNFPEPATEKITFQLLMRRDNPDKATWTAVVAEALKRFQNSELEKVVLARESTLDFADPVDAPAVLQGLRAITPFSYHFYFQPGGDETFLGASPERLYRRIGHALQSEALAGTRPRGKTPNDDDALGKELHRSTKEQHEHRLVAQSIQRAFETHCRAIRGNRHPDLLVLKHCQHLITRFEGMLINPGNDPGVMASLHPTPAVGGVPTDAALEFIRGAEPFDRGWYAGPVGWIAADAAEFAVAIRSALVRGKRLSMFAGAGIVEGSDPGQEWLEIENKMADFVGIFATNAATKPVP